MFPCSSDKWFIIELCEEIGIQTIEIANFEYFSSTFKDFELQGGEKYVLLFFFNVYKLCLNKQTSSFPTDNWVPIANLTAHNARKVQSFQLEEPVWFKY